MLNKILLSIITLFLLSLNGYSQDDFKVTKENFLEDISLFNDIGDPKRIKNFVEDMIGFYIYDNLSNDSKDGINLYFQKKEVLILKTNFTISYHSKKAENILFIKTDISEEIQFEIKNLIHSLNFDDFFKVFNISQNIKFDTEFKYVKPKTSNKLIFIFLPSRYIPMSKMTSMGATKRKKTFSNIKEFCSYEDSFNNQLVNSKFNPSLTSTIGLKRFEKIFAFYSFDQNGNFINIDAIASHLTLKKEALDVFKDRNCKCIPPNYYGYFNYERIKPIIFRTD